MAGAPPDHRLLGRMAAALRHRGPDDEAFLATPDAGLAFRRLSIIDVAGGRQPLANEDETAWIVLNGEIYNHRRLRQDLERRGHRFRTRSDAEVVLHLWEEEGKGCLRHLEGMFALAIWSGPEGALLLARDRLGKKPLYYHHAAGGRLVFGSEIKALLQDPSIPRRPAQDALAQFLTLQYVPSPGTAFEGVRRVPAAGWLTWREGVVETGCYWRPEYRSKLVATPDELAAQLLQLLRGAVADRLESDVPLGAFLSGGIDSSTVVALAAEALGAPLNTFSVGFRERTHDESHYARLVANRHRTRHHELMITASPDPALLERIAWHHDQPFGDSSAVPSYLVAQSTREHVTVVLTGDGGDEVFGGYDRYRRMQALRHLYSAPRALRRLAFAVAPLAGRGGRRLALERPESAREAYFQALVHLGRHQLVSLATPAFAQALPAEPAPLSHLRHSQAPSLGDAMLETDVHHYLPDDLLVKLDVSTMAHGLEARSPLLDHRVVEFMAGVPAELKLGARQGKLLLRRAVSGLLPEPVLARPKRGFAVPLGDWLRGGLRPLLQDVVLSPLALDRGYLQPAAVRRLVEQHMAGSNANQYVLWDLVMLELWHRQFIDRPPATTPPR